MWQPTTHLHGGIGESWNEQVETHLEEWAERAEGHRTMNLEAASYYLWWHKAIGLPSAIASAVTTAGAFTSLAEDEPHI